MDLAWHHWKLVLVLGLSGSLLGCKSPFGGQAVQPSGSTPPAQPNAITKAWKSTTESVAGAFASKPKTPDNDPTSLSTPNAKISANTHVATGRLMESRQEMDKAKVEYEKAIKAEPTHLTALVSMARLQDRQGHPDQAIVTYQKALKAHPESALIRNDLGLCYARNHDLASAVAMLSKAVEMEPAKPNYRNNLATVLVEAGRTDDALKHLQAVHAPAAAHYNLAFLLNHHGQTDLARRHLTQAVQIDPSFAAAQEMLAQLDGNNASPPAGPAESPQLGAAPQGGPYGPVAPTQPNADPGYPTGGAVPAQSLEPIYHIGNEGIETSPADGPALNQPTSHQYPTGPAAGAPLGYHLDDSAADGVLVVTNLVYGTDKDPAPQPANLVEDETSKGEETTSEQDPQPENVKPVSQLPTLYPVVE